MSWENEFDKLKARCQVQQLDASMSLDTAYRAVADIQAQGGICGYVDIHHYLDPEQAERCGVNLNDLYIYQGDLRMTDDSIFEESYRVANSLMSSGAIDLVIISSEAGTLFVRKGT